MLTARRTKLPVVLLSVTACLALAFGLVSGRQRAGADLALPTTVRLVAGTASVTDDTGQVWAADAPFAGGGRLSSSTRPILDTSTQALFVTQRFAMTGYRIPVAPGTYVVTLNMAEHYWSRPGQRVFDVAANGDPVIAGLDIVARAGVYHAYRLSFPVAVTNGTLVLDFTNRVDLAAITGISVLPATMAAPIGPAPASSAPVSSAPASSAPVAIKPSPAPASSAPAGPTTNPAPTSPKPTSAAGTGSTEAPQGSDAVARIVRPESFGARGDGRTDDTAALQRTFDSAPAGAVVTLTAGRVYLHSDVLHVRRTGLRVTGAAVLLATTEARSSVWLEADNVVLDGGLVIRVARTTTRWSAWEQMGVRVFGHRGIVLRNVTVDGSAAAGIYVGNQANHFLLDHVTVQNTRADGIHMTMGANNGRVVAPTVRNSGDDGVAVVSYAADGSPCHDITVTSPRVLGTSWGRGLSVVGGVNIAETDIDVERTSAGAIYVAAEGNPWFSTAPQSVSFSGGVIIGANTNAAVDHGAVLVMSGESGPTPSNVSISHLTITGTRANATRNFGIVSYGTAPRSIVFTDLTVNGGPRSAYQGNAPSASFTLVGVSHNGVAVGLHG